MKTQIALVSAVLLIAAGSAYAQGAPSAEGQSVSASGAAGADKAVQKRSDAAAARAKARADKRAAKKASKRASAASM